MMNDQIRNIMTATPVTVSPESTLTDVASIFKQRRIHHLPVVKSGKLVGLVTTYDLWKLNEKQDNYKHIHVSEIMSTNLCKISPIDKVGTAAELLMDKRFHALPVVNLRGELKGIVTSFDVMRYVMNREYPTPILYKEVLGLRAMS
ncbi:CBS domain-containing protein [Saprospiraceae bacterium]|nr:CBS domain-containing protein [Saprospiraceae bacterium]